MSRLTYYDAKQKQYIRLASRLAVDNRLGKLEDLEEQLGCPLEVRCKIVTNSSIFVDDTEEQELKVGLVFEDGFYADSWVRDNQERFFKYKDYKVTWWLREDKEE